MQIAAAKQSSATRGAPAKVILLGEHSVVYGQPAIAAAIDCRLEVRLRRRNGASPPRREEGRVGEALAVATRSFGLDPTRLELTIRSDIPPAAGLGSSAALSVALVGALADLEGVELRLPDLVARATEVENVFHGTASGVDVAAVASGGVIWFERHMPGPVRFRPGRPLELVVGQSGQPRSTASPVARLRARVAAHPRVYHALFGLAGETAREGAEAVAGGEWERLGALFDVAHGLLNAFGVSTPTLERMVACARAAGALGAKLTGAGGGGAMIALAPGRGTEIAAALEAEGFRAFVTRIETNRQEGHDANLSTRTV